MLNRRNFLAFAALSPLASHLRAQDNWPSKPIRIVSAGVAGGTNDVLARFLAEPLSKLLGQPVIIESKAGAGGALGVQYVAQQPADGHTLLTHHNGFVTSTLVRANPGYTVKSLVPASLQGTSPLILMAHPSMPATLAEFVAFARTQPGKLEWGTGSMGGVGHLAIEVFNDMANIKDMVGVPFNGSVPAIQALVGGQIKYLMSVPSSSTGGLVKEGRLRYLGHSYAKRSAALPDVPAIAEAVPGFSADAWYGLLVRAGTPQNILDRLSTALSTVLSQPSVVEQYATLYVQAKPGRAELASLIERDGELWTRVIKERNIRVD
jgi:tripartite-type tricarboxylate transporter receptor subunit TctC